MAISRRSFLKSSTATAAIALSGGITRPVLAAQSPALAPGPGNKWPGRVVINFNKKAVSGTLTPEIAVIKKMVDDAIRLLTGQSTVGAAWKELFPASLSLQSKIAIKVTTVNIQLPGPHWSSVRAITDGLQMMEIDGQKFPGANITIFDMYFEDNYSRKPTMPATGYVPENFPGGVVIATTVLADGGDGAMNNHKYAAVLKDADFLVNVFSPRGHTSPPVGSRFTLGFKSHVGTYSSEWKKEGPSLHANLMQNIKDMHCTGPIYKKNVLSVCSGIFGLNEGVGPPGEPQDYQTYAKTMDDSISGGANPTTIIMSTDPLTVEMQTIKMMRLNKGGKYDVDSLPPYLQSCAGMTGKMDGTVYNIGIIDEDKVIDGKKIMEVRRVINEVTAIAPQPALRSCASQSGISVSAIRGQSTFFEFRLPGDFAGRTASIGIFSIDGSAVYNREIALLGAMNHFSWDHRGANGMPVARGPYVVRVTCGKVRLSKQFLIPA